MSEGKNSAEAKEEIGNQSDDSSNKWVCQCGVKFKRRGMLVNHVLRRHADMSLSSACPALQLPLLRPSETFHCPFCCKVYRSSTKRKQHVSKSHPGNSWPQKTSSEKKADPLKCKNGTVAVTISQCPESQCYKQFATRAKLIQHMRKKHSKEDVPTRAANVLNVDNAPVSQQVEVVPREILTNQQAMIPKHHDGLPFSTMESSNFKFILASANEDTFSSPSDVIIFEDSVEVEAAKNETRNDSNKVNFIFNDDVAENIISDEGCNTLELVEEYLKENTVFNTSSFELPPLTLSDELNKDAENMMESIDSLTWSNKSLETNSAFEMDFKISDSFQNQHKCHVCGKCFFRSFVLKQHMRRHDPAVKRRNIVHHKKIVKVRRNAIVRSRKLTTSQSTKKLKNKVASPLLRSHPCNQCASTFTSKSKLKMHLLKHSEYREFECSSCGQQFKRKDKYKRHIKMKHSGDATPHTEPIKSRTFKSESKENEGSWRCHCGSSFKRRGMMVNHAWKKHPEMKLSDACPSVQKPVLRPATQFHCPRCSKVYKSSSKCKQHVLKNHPSFPFPLSTRDSQSGNKNITTSSSGQVAVNVSHCPVKPCHKQYATRAKLGQHIRAKHPDYRFTSEADQTKRDDIFLTNQLYLSTMLDDTTSNHSMVEIFPENSAKVEFPLRTTEKANMLLQEAPFIEAATSSHAHINLNDCLADLEFGNVKSESQNINFMFD